MIFGILDLDTLLYLKVHNSIYNREVLFQSSTRFIIPCLPQDGIYTVNNIIPKEERQAGYKILAIISH